MNINAPIGMYDSGIGGISVWREIRRSLSSENIIYVADQAHAPYGDRTREELFSFGRGMARFLQDQGAKAVVIACNSSSATVLNTIRRELPDIVFVGTANALQAAVEECQVQHIGIIATQATLAGDFLTGKTMRMKRGQKIYRQPCPGLAIRIEQGDTESAELEEMLRGWLQPMLDKGIDGLILGCTHYPFASDMIRKIVGPGIQLIDPAPTIARHIRNALSESKLLAPDGQPGHDRFITTSDDANRFAARLRTLGVQSENLRRAAWEYSPSHPTLSLAD
jgi:glutamate racemase